MILRTGEARGFTFIELMTAISVLSLGLVMILRIFLSSLDYVNHAAGRLYAGLEADNQLWEMQDIFNRSEEKCDFPPRGEQENEGVKFEWRASVALLDETVSLYKMILNLTWANKGKKNSLSRAAYVGR